MFSFINIDEKEAELAGSCFLGLIGLNLAINLIIIGISTVSKLVAIIKVKCRNK